jgi:uncharacterized repeat protein (TIGR03803 family)
MVMERFTKMTKTGKVTVLHSFNYDGTDGFYPYSGVVLDTAGNIYGTTYEGGTNYYYGTVYKISPTGTETILHSFKNDGTDGFYPWAGVVLDTAGDIYGTTYEGGAYGYGTVFKVIP